MSRRTSAGYHAVAEGSQVDESLFGRRPSSKRETLAAAGSFISSGDLARIKETLTTKSNVELSMAAKRGEPMPKATVRGNAEAAARRKTRMQQIDDDRLRSKATSGEADIEEQIAVRAKLAPRIKDHDAVKFMKTLEARAEALAGREAQLAEKKRVANREKSFEAKAHKVMMRTIAAERERDVAEHRAMMEKNKRDAAALQEQISRREQARLLEKERVIQEGEQMKAQWAAQKKIEKQEEIARAERAAKIRADLVAANEVAGKRRAEVARIEAVVDRRSLRWLQKKAAAEAEREAAELERKARAEREVAKLRAEQERASDKKAAEDEAKAKRAQEKYELDYRAREKAKEDDAAKRRSEQLAVLQAQMEHRKRLKEEEKRMDGKVMRRLVRTQAREAERLDEEARKKAAAAKAHQAELLKQIADNKTRERAVRNARLEERKQILLERRLEEELLNEEKAAVLANLQKEKGIDGAYVRDIALLKPGKETSFAKAPV